jgi:hypothetical protein
VIPRPPRARLVGVRRATGIAVVGAVAGLLVVGVAFGCSGDDRGDEPLSVQAFCERLAETQPLDDQLGRIETTELRATFEDLEALASEAPPTVQPAMQVLTDYVGKVVDALDDVEPGDEEAARDALRTLDQDDLEEVEAAGDEVDRYSADECGLDLETGSTVAPTSAPPTVAPEPDADTSTTVG